MVSVGSIHILLGILSHFVYDSVIGKASIILLVLAFVLWMKNNPWYRAVLLTASVGFFVGALQMKNQKKEGYMASQSALFGKDSPYSETKELPYTRYGFAPQRRVTWSPEEIQAVRAYETHDNKCRMPTRDNPSGNLSFMDYLSDPNRPPACPATLVEDESDKLATRGLYLGPQDSMNKSIMARTFYSWNLEVLSKVLLWLIYQIHLRLM